MPPVQFNAKQQTVYICRGLPGSGKSTWALKMLDFAKKRGFRDLIRLNKDEIREELLPPGDSWSKPFEEHVRKVHQARLDMALRDGQSVIDDNTHLNRGTLSGLTDYLEDLKTRKQFKDLQVEIVDFTDVPVHTCIDRDRERQARGERFVGAEVILKMARQAGIEEIIVPNPVDWSLPWAIISDLDGTLALFGNKRDPYDASHCDTIDEANFSVASILRTYSSGAGSPEVEKIFFFSGRTDKYKEATERFLLKNGFDTSDQFFRLVMRKEGDFTADEVIKKQMYEEEIKGKYNVLCVFDDRPKVIRMWKSLGLPVFNVGNSVEF
jgi:predicted kinase